MNFPQRRRQGGFTLIELMITVAIVAILARVAYGSYQGSIIKTRRANAAACLVEMSQFMERFYTTKFTYVGGDPTTLQCDNDLANFYTLAMGTGANVATATTFVIQAAPTSRQNDAKCGTLSINQAGTKSESGTGTVAECW